MRASSKRQISNYELQALIKSDLTFALYKAIDIQTETECYLELIFPEKKCSEEFISKFQSRADLLSVIEHPHLLNVIGYGQENNACYLVFEYFEGAFLSDFKEFPTPEKDAAQMLSQAAEGLSFLHRQDIAHGNLSPENIMVGHDGEIKLMNFGLADLISAEAAFMLPEGAVGIGCGTPGYIAPEQILSQKPSFSGDIYALGALYYTLLMEKMPHSGISPTETMFKELTSQLSWPIDRYKKCSETSIRFIYRCLAKNPSERFADILSVENILKKIAAGKHPHIRIKKKLMKGAPRKFSFLWPASAILALILFGAWMYLPERLVGKEVPPTALSPVSTATPEKGPTATATFITKFEVSKETISANFIAKNTPSKILEISPTPDPNLIYRPALVNTPFPGELKLITFDNIDELKELTRIGSGKLIQITYAHDNKTQAIASTAGVMIIDSLHFIQFIDPKDSASSVAFSLDDEILAIGTNNGDIQLWNWKVPELKATLKGHTGRVSKILFSNNRRQLASASYDLNIKIWDLNSGTQVKNIPAHPLPIKDISLSDDGRFLVSGAADQIVKVWDFSSGEKITEFRHSSSIEAVAVSPDGTYVAAGGASGEINQWNIQARQLRGDPIPVQSPIWNLYYSQDGNYLLVGTESGKSVKVDARPKKFLWKERKMEVDNYKLTLLDIYGSDFELSSSVAVAPDFFSVASINWDGEVNNSFDNPYHFIQYDDYFRLSFSPDSRYLLIGGKNNFYLLLDTKLNQIVNQDNMIAPPGSPFSPSSDSVAIIKREYLGPYYAQLPVYQEALIVYPFLQNKNKSNLGIIPNNSSIQYVENGALVATGNLMDTKVWDTLNNNEVHLSEGFDSGCQVIRSTNDGKILSITSSLGPIPVWDDMTRKICGLSNRLKGSLGAFSKDRKWFAFINQKKVLEVLDLETDQTISKVLLTHEPTAITFSDDGLSLLVGYQDGYLDIWSTADGKLIQSWKGHFGPVHAVAFSPNQKMIVSSSFDGTTRIWGIANH